MNTGGRVRAERRLAAILAADVAGYSRLIGADEEPALDRLSSTRAEGLRVNRCAFCSAAHEHE
jgi:adenylate cyclase